MPTTDDLDTRIRALITELAEAAPPAPTLSELESRDAFGVAPPKHLRQWAGQRRTRFALVGGLGAVVAVVLLLVLLLPSVGQREPVAAAAQLNLIAANAASQATPTLSEGQYLEMESHVSLLATVSQVGSTPTPNAQATIDATLKQWTDKFGDSCLSFSSRPTQFASPINQAAWKAAGVLNSPTSQPVTSCESVSDSPIPSTSASPQGGSIIDVSSLPTDPSTLAHELSAGTTGIAALDQIAMTTGGNAGFERAANLLVGPTAGATLAFTSALFRALALIPGIQTHGQMTTHSGAKGLGFSGDTTTGQSTIIVDPSNGALLEARNLTTPFLFQGVAPSYLAPAPAPSIGTEGGSYGVVIQWLDPVSSPTVVDSLPAGITVAEPAPVPAAIKGVADLSTTYAQLQQLETQLGQHFGSSTSSSYSAPSSVLHSSGFPVTTTAGGAVVSIGAIVEYELSSVTQMHQYARAMQSSGLFASISEYVGKGHPGAVNGTEISPHPAPKAVVEKATAIPEAVYDTVGVTGPIEGTPITKPIILSGQPPLELGSAKPTVLWVGANYCPYCAANRWALVAALSRFGTWSRLSLTTSSPDDVFPGTNSFTFAGSIYSSPYLSFVSVEQDSSSTPAPDGGSTPLQTLTKQEQRIVSTYESSAFIPGAVSGSNAIPFIDIGNRALVSGAMFNPGVLAGQSWGDIADQLSNPSSPVTKAIVSSANEITAAICATAKGSPRSVCDSPGVRAAGSSLGLG